MGELKGEEICEVNRLVVLSSEKEEYGSVISKQEIKELTKNVVRQYFEDHNDSTIIAFGKAGSRIIKRMLPMEGNNTKFHTINLETGVVRMTQTKKKSRGISRRSTFLEVDLEENSISVNNYSRNGVAVESVFYKINNITVSYDKFTISPKLVANEILANIEKSSYFILVSGFGGSFAQPLHIEFSEMLRKRRIPHLNVVIKPSRLEKDKRSIAQRGIIKLSREDSVPYVYDNDEVLDKKKMAETINAAELLDKINEKIGMDIYLYNLRITDRLGILKERSGIIHN